MLRWLWDNLSSLLLALVLALSVWVAAVNAADPIVERAFPDLIPIEYQGLASGLQIVGSPPTRGRVTVRAPTSVWDQLRADQLHLRVRLTGLAAGRFPIRVEAEVDRRPARVTIYDPASLILTIEPAADKDVPVRVTSAGEPALGYRAEAPSATPDHVQVHGPASLVARVEAALAEVDLGARREDLDAEIKLVPVDSDGQAVSGVEPDPGATRVRVPIHQLVGYRLVAVIPIIQGQADPGYQVTNIAVTPSLVTVFSPDPQAVDSLPGFVETEPIGLSGAHDNIESTVALILPKGVFLAGPQTILVQISINAIEVTTTLTRTLELQGLAPGLVPQPSPATVSVILKGPLPTLDRLRPEDVRVVLDLTALGPGVHQVAPTVLTLPPGVVLQTILPDTVEVIITAASTPVPSSTP